MTELITVRETIDGAQIEGSATASVESALRAAINAFVQQRSDWRDGYSIQLGWGPLILSERNQTFVITTPDYRDDPRSDLSDDLSSPMWMLLGQNLVIRESGVEPVDVRFDQELISTLEWDESRQLMLSRIEPKGDDSGWFIQPFPPRQDSDWQPHELERMDLWYAVQLRPAIGRVLALPPGVSAVIDGDHVSSVIRDADQAVLAEGL